MILYVFEYCPCRFESAFETISLHFKKIDAFQAMKKRKGEELQKWNDMLKVCGKRGHRGDKPCEDMLFRIKKRVVV